jgi:hypothetical protein
MLPLHVAEYLHLLFAFVYVAALFASHWNTLAARRTQDWGERGGLFELNRRLSMMFSLPALIGTGIVGNVLAMQLGFRMSETRSLQIVTGLWLVLLVLVLAIDVPISSRLAAMARATAGSATGGEPVEWKASLGRWRLGNGLQLFVFVVLLWFMVAAWKP